MAWTYFREFFPCGHLVGSFICWCCITAVFGAPATAQSFRDEMVAASVVRMVTAAELDYVRSKGRYATYKELVSSGQLEQSAKNSVDDLRVYRRLDLRADSEPFPGLVLRIVVAGDRPAYELSLLRRTAECGASLFSNETGVVYEGKLLNCVEARNWSPAKWGPADVDQVVPTVRRPGDCPAQLLRQTSERIEQLVENLQQFSARERIDHAEIARNGKRHRAASSTFDYVAEINQVVSGPPTVGEYRTSSDEAEAPRAQPVDTGTAAFALLFHPSLVSEFNINCEGLTDVGARPAWQLHFAQRRDRPNQFHGFRVASNFYPIKLKGRAWVAADNYEVLRLETDLMEPIRAIRLEKEHSVIEYGPVEFAKRKVRLWLPQVAELYIDYGGHRYQRRHTFSNFHLFLVEAGQQVKLPREMQGAQPDHR